MNRGITNRMPRAMAVVALLTAAFSLAVFAQKTPGTRTNASTRVVADVPPLPMLASPVSFFRQLLVISPEERALRLADRTPENRQRLVEKIREYRALGADECELRLQATELRWYLMQLLRLPATNRAELLVSVPAALLPLVSSRLEQWDLLPPSWQSEVLTNDQAMRFVTRPGTAQPISTRLNAMNEEKRRRALEFLDKLCTLTPVEKSRALKTVSAEERKEIEKTLQTFAALPPDQRGRCIRSYEKFTGMAPAEKKEFLRNAKRWEAMSPAERQSWRILVNAMKNLPPLPEGFDHPLPPLPPSPKPRAPKPNVATNN